MKALLKAARLATVGALSIGLLAPLSAMSAAAQSVQDDNGEPTRAKASNASPMIVAVEDGIDRDDGVVDEKSLRFTDMRINIVAQDLTAEVTMDVRIANQTDDEMEGRFSLVLPQDAVVTGYALDIEGQMIDGVLMDQPKAKAVYRNEVRGRIDPGLAEVTSGNKFSTKIYPIAAEGHRTIRIRFSAPMDSVEGLILPLKTASPVTRFSAAGKWADGSRAPVKYLTKLDGMPGELPLDGFVQLKPPAATKELVASQHQSGQNYFQLSGKSEQRPTIRKGDTLRIYWDRSLSRRDDLLAEEIALASHLVNRVQPRSVELVSFTSSDHKVTKINDTASLPAHLKAMTYRGGTSYAGLDKATRSHADSCLLFSDGDTTIDVAARFDPGCRLVVITSAADANRTRLGKLARESGGNLLTLNRNNGDALVDLIMRGDGRAPILRDSGGRVIATRNFAMRDGSWLAIGPLPKDRIVTMEDERLRANDVQPSNAAGALWVAEEVTALADNPLDRTKMRALALSHQVATPTMAFLVLEEPEQYVNADIVPPKGFNAEWMKQYQSALKSRQSDKADDVEDRLSDVVDEWEERKEWWAEKYDGKYDKRSGRAETEMYAPPPPPPVVSEPSPVPAPPVDAASAAESSGYSDDDGAYDNIVVTGTAAIPPGSLRQLDTEVQNVLSDQPYLRALDAAQPSSRLAVLAGLEKEHGTLPAFYFDTAEWFRLKGDKETAMQLLLSALELPLSDDETRQIVAFRLQREGSIDSAIALLERLAVTSDFRPQPKRQLALALAERGKRAGSKGRADLERAFQLLTEVALEPAENEYDGIEVVALMEANALISYIEQLGGKWSLDKRLRGLLDTDARIVIEWTNDDADLDLHVIEPSSEKVYYGHRLSVAGGTITNDMTDGYGPEEYAIRRARSGKYKVTVHGYSPDRLNPNGKGRVMVRLIHNFGRANQREELIDADISFRDEEEEDNGKHIATMTVGGAAKR